MIQLYVDDPALFSQLLWRRLDVDTVLEIKHGDQFGTKIDSLLPTSKKGSAEPEGDASVSRKSVAESENTVFVVSPGNKLLGIKLFETLIELGLKNGFSSSEKDGEDSDCFSGGWRHEDDSRILANRVMLLEFLLMWFFMEQKLTEQSVALNPLLILASSVRRFELFSKCLISEALALNPPQKKIS